jgi:hypothetical protein
MSESMLARVARIIANAEECQRAGNIADAEAAFAKADAIMVKHAIDAAMIASRVKDRSSVEREKPVSVTIPFVPGYVDFYQEYRTMLTEIARHCRVRPVTHYSVSDKPEVVLVGFAADVEYMQMIWNSVFLGFLSRIDPKWDDSRPADENIKILKESGRKWGEIAEVANEHGFECTANDGRLKAAYRRQCKAEGVEPTSHTQRHRAYRVSYAEAFEAEISTRLYRMRRAAEQQEAGTTGSTVALRDRAQDVNEALYEMFPDLRPMTEEQKAARDARHTELRAKEEARRAGLTDKQRAAEDAKRERDEARWQRQYEREQARLTDAAGRRAGRRAASSIDLGGSKVGTSRAGEIGS